MRPRDDIERMIDSHGDAIWRVCVVYFGATPDSQDAFQETTLKYALADTTSFSDEEHCKAWLIRVATNVCKDMIKASHRKNLPLEESVGTPLFCTSDESGSGFQEIIDAIRALTDPPRAPVYLSLYEGYTAPEISEILDMPINTVYSWIARGKEQLREVLG